MQGGSTGSPGGNNWLVVNTCGRQRDPDLLKDTMSAVRLTIQLERFFNMHNRVPGFLMHGWEGAAPSHTSRLLWLLHRHSFLY